MDRLRIRTVWVGVHLFIHSSIVILYPGQVHHGQDVSLSQGTIPHPFTHKRQFRDSDQLTSHDFGLEIGVPGGSPEAWEEHANSTHTSTRAQGSFAEGIRHYQPPCRLASS